MVSPRAFRKSALTFASSKSHAQTVQTSAKSTVNSRTQQVHKSDMSRRRRIQDAVGRVEGSRIEPGIPAVVSQGLQHQNVYGTGIMCIWCLITNNGFYRSGVYWIHHTIHAHLSMYTLHMGKYACMDVWCMCMHACTSMYVYRYLDVIFLHHPSRFHA